jgi:hydroxymethylbilane synthase
MSQIPESKVRLGARGSLLSRMQSQSMLNALKLRHPNVQFELVLIQTTGDRITDKPLHDAGGKGLFTKEIELALLAGEIDIAVHSYKDVPVTMPLVDQAELVIAAVPSREDPRDLMISSKARRLGELPAGAKVGTGSLRRRCQILAQRPDLKIELIRGNIDTRLRKLRGGEFDAIFLALAGLRRAGLFDPADMTPVEFEEMLPAAGQGALALQCRRNDARVTKILVGVHSQADALCVNLERSVVAALGGDCHSPIAALATVDGNNLALRVAVGARGGELPVIRADARGDADGLLARVMEDLSRQGVGKMLS